MTGKSWKIVWLVVAALFGGPASCMSGDRTDGSDLDGGSDSDSDTDSFSDSDTDTGSDTTPCTPGDYWCDGTCIPTEPVSFDCKGLDWAGCCADLDTLLFCSGGLWCWDCLGGTGCGWDAEYNMYDCGYSGSDPTGAVPRECPS